MSTPNHLLLETNHWTIEQRPDATLPGYLLMCAKERSTHLWELPSAALEEMGPLLSNIQQLIMQVLAPRYLHIGRYGHMRGPSFHFHFIPIYDWVIQGFLKDKRYANLKQFQTRTDGAFSERQFDAADIQLYVWREFCENPISPKIEGPSLQEAFQLLKMNQPKISSALLT